MACESWPALKEVIIYSNPLTRITSGNSSVLSLQQAVWAFVYLPECLYHTLLIQPTGMPRLLQTRLVDDRGITVIRFAPLIAPPQSTSGVKVLSSLYHQTAAQPSKTTRHWSGSQRLQEGSRKAFISASSVRLSCHNNLGWTFAGVYSPTPHHPQAPPPSLTGGTARSSPDAGVPLNPSLLRQEWFISSDTE